MVAYSFKRQFADKVEAGTKRQTIRAPRTRHARPGETVQLYTGMRTKACRKLGEAECVAVRRIFVDTAADRIEIVSETEPNTLLTKWPELAEFARADGFEGWSDMRQFFQTEGGTFEGVLIQWAPPQAAERTEPQTGASLGEPQNPKADNGEGK